MFILINPIAAGGRALAKWKKVISYLDLDSPLTHCYTLIDNVSTNYQTIINALKNGEREFVAAGGDGTVNFLLNTLLPFTEDNYFHNIKDTLHHAKKISAAVVDS